MCVHIAMPRGRPMQWACGRVTLASLSFSFTEALNNNNNVGNF
jgi:hypothetical protein